jgi:hypothetical protein
VKAGGKQSSFTLVSCSVYSVILKKGAIFSSEMSVDFKRNTRRYIAEDGTLHPSLCFLRSSFCDIKFFLELYYLFFMLL